jgi:hypothetical protein
MTPEDAAVVIGVPEVVLRRWAWTNVGPKNRGTKLKPLYDRDDLEDYLAAKRGREP